MLKKWLIALVGAAILQSTPAVLFGAGADAANDKRPLELQDVLEWKSIQIPIISNNGDWLAYQIVPGEGDGEVVLRATKSDKELRFPIGEAPPPPRRGAGSLPLEPDNLAFSEDSQWLAFTIYPTREEAKKLAKEKKKPEKKLGLVNLTTEEKLEFDKIERFAFSGEAGGWIAMHKAGEWTEEGSGGDGNGGDENQPKGSDLLLRELATGRMLNSGNVSEFAFNKSGEWLAITIDAEDQYGNGVQLRNMESSSLLVLDSEKSSYSGLSWTKEGDGLALLKGTDDEDYENKRHSLLAFRDLASSTPRRIAYDPTGDDQFPADMTIGSRRKPQWTEDLSAVLFGIVELKEKEKTEEAEGNGGGEAEETIDESKESAKDEPEEPGLVIWHWLDKRLQSQQQVQEQRDEDFTYLSIYRVEEKKFIRLADEEVREVSAEPDDRFAIGLDQKEYELTGNLVGRRFRDVYAIDLRTGERRLAKKKVRWYFGENPQADHFLYYEGGHFHTYDMATGGHTNVSESVPTSFVDEEDDHNVVDPPVSPVGWSEDGEHVLLYDNWDVWRVSTTGSAATNLTVDGKKEAVRYDRVHRLEKDEQGIDLSRPVYFNAYGEWSKKSGIARLEPGGSRPEMLFWEDALFSDLLKAEDTEDYLYSRQTHVDYPDLYYAGPDLADGSRLTAANPQQEDFLWSEGSLLIDYVSDKGDKLQAVLHLPAGYREGESYPTIVYIYEKLSQGRNRYYQPVAYSFNKSVYTSNGYAVLMPDITYQVNDPGMSSVWCVLPALRAALATGVVDADRIGLHGHSWGGYQTSFLITQTEAFRAAVAGAPLTNMISMYSSIYWNSGSANQPIFESSQGRFYGNYLEHLEAYARNSPVYHAANVATPLMILHNDKDGAVDWNQGIEYFNTLRQLGKSVVMLQYEGENHGLRKLPNRKDYFIRMNEFFDHHLKGESAPRWLADGISHLDHDEHLKERARQIEKKKKDSESER